MGTTNGKTESQTNHWQDRAIIATRGNATRLGAILLAALGRAEADDQPRFVGRASVTSDGFVLCDYVGLDGAHHPGAFVGDVVDLVSNTINLARHLNLSEIDSRTLYAVVQRWIVQDHRDTPGLGFPL